MGVAKPHLKRVVAAIRKKDLVLPRWAVHCLHVRFAPRMQGRVTLNCCAILLSSRNLQVTLMCPGYSSLPTTPSTPFLPSAGPSNPQFARFLGEAAYC